MERRRKKDRLSHGPSYNRLHGAPPSQNLRSSASTPEFSNRPRVRFHESVQSYEGAADVRGLASPSRHGGSSRDAELEHVMQHYGISGMHDDGLPSTSINPVSHMHPAAASEHNQRLTSFGLSVMGAVTNGLIAYPCLVLRRQCQVNHLGVKYHLTPFSLLGPAINMQRAQGLTCLWKGIGSNMWVNAIQIGAETAIGELSSGRLPREISNNTNFQNCISHIGLKTIVGIIVSPFFSAHLVESVQSEMTSESPGLLSCLSGGFCRFFGLGIQSPKILPFYQLIIPTVFCSVSRYVLSSLLEQLILYIMKTYSRQQQERRLARLQPKSPVFEKNNMFPSSDLQQPITPDGEPSQSVLDTYYPELVAGFVAELISDVALYPLETVLHRLHVQGTRTIIDNTDTGKGFLAVSSKYEGLFDCFSSTVSHEGYLGLYRGFGALSMQYACKYAMLSVTRLVLAIASNET